MFSSFAKNKVQKPLPAEPAKQEPPNQPARAETTVKQTPSVATPKVSSNYTEMKVLLHQRLLDMINLSAIDKMAPDDFRREMGEMVRELLLEENRALNLSERTQLVNDICDEVLGLGPLEPLLKDDTVNDILVNGHAQVFAERGGKLELTAVRFKDDRHLLRIIDKIVSAVGRRVDESQPMVDARLADGSRFNAIIAPLAVDGPLVSIRKFSKSPISMEKLVSFGALPQRVADFLKGVVEARHNMVISGGTGSGKTTMLNACSAFIDAAERILTIEDAAELQLQQVHVARLETRPANIEGKGEVTQRELVKNALRMRPDRVILGECRAGEAFDMLQAMNTGHDGSMTTVHANSSRDALSRIEQMVGMAGMDLPQTTIRAQIASAVHVIVQVARLGDGKRRLLAVSEITGMEGDVITMQDIFKYQRISTDEDGTIHGRFVATGIRPKVMEEFQSRGIHMPDSIFDPSNKIE